MTRADSLRLAFLLAASFGAWWLAETRGWLYEARSRLRQWRCDYRLRRAAWRRTLRDRVLAEGVRRD